MRHLPALLFLCLAPLSAQTVPEANYDESKVGSYTLPDPLTLASGKPVADAADWNRLRRPEILRLFEDQVFGRTVAPAGKPLFEVTEAAGKALDGKATRRQVTIWLTGRKPGPKLDLILYLPASAASPVPVFVGLGFRPNASVSSDPAVPLASDWTRDPNDKTSYVKAPSPESVRGSAAARWQLDKIIAAGFGLAHANYQDIEPDFAGALKDSVRQAYLRPGQTQPAANEWGAIGAWSWGLSRIVDYLATDKSVDSSKLALIGHSRLGKTALWAGAQDTRFAIVISNDSGEGGAALARRNYGETLFRINTAFPHWFCANYKAYNQAVDKLPVDAHMLIALIAPRPVYVASAEEDKWADPRGEFLSAVSAGRVYSLLGKKGLGTDQMPPIHQPIMNTIGYHIRAGKHDVTAYDWDQYIKFARMHFSR
ncbi:MAG: acetylxylan esterase [Acidobacteria bacterium]|nr:acetylxylan esterase [Acidobacteriota bacterium]